MNRRRFFGFLAAAPVAVATMPAQGRPFTYTGGLYDPRGVIGTIGERGPEAIMPLRKMERLTVKFDKDEIARVMRKIEADMDAKLSRDLSGMNLARLHNPDASQTFSEGGGI